MTLTYSRGLILDPISRNDWTTRIEYGKPTVNLEPSADMQSRTQHRNTKHYVYIGHHFNGTTFPVALFIPSTAPNKNIEK